MTITDALKQAGIENAAQEAAWIAKYHNGQLSIDEIVRRRCNGEPLQYLLGEWEFCGYPFKVGKGVLIPRPETELLVDLAKPFNCDVFDLCAGSGCVGIALTKQTKRNVMAVEKSPEAVAYLQQNITLNGVERCVQIFQNDIFDPDLLMVVNQVLSLITCPAAILINPPYLSKDEILSLQKEVRHEPMTALFGGGDGLDFFRTFFDVWADTLNRVKLFACEVGIGQADQVSRMMQDIGLSPQIKQDYNKIDRIVYSIK